ncbi:cardiolipin synthase [Microbacter margulisiae]|uniref:Cardiolipin synthase n=1 Tax=Microbacter margulisiae TaxID=1350067 RepID=A0A7W5H2Q1_9PORP|nr:cardiolipin synthase [Microbacter margulisiae]MBB3187686.1 cardiolipin synthase [Microbacter margulisiae]
MLYFDTVSGWLLVAIYLFTVIPTISVILLENRNPVKSLSWILVLLFLPWLGFVLYLYFGQDYRRQKIVSRKSIRRLGEIPKIRAEEADLENKTLPVHHQLLIRLLQKNSDAFPFCGNKLVAYGDERETFKRLFSVIANAKHEINAEFYIIENDVVGKQFLNLLMQKALEGVKVRLIFDYVGSFHFKRSLQRTLRKAGIEIFPFLPVHFKVTLRRNRVNYRNHRKIIIIDGEVGFTGGINMAARYLVGNKLGRWRDTFLEVDGPAVYGLLNAFLIDWYFVSRELLNIENLYSNIRIHDNLNVVQIVTSGPDSDWESIMQGIVSAINTATKYVYVQTPYFMPTEVVISALQIAAMGGVDVRVMLPERTDTWMTQSSSYSYITQSLEAGVKIYLYRNAFLHSKTIVIDDHFSTVGSANMDFRSYEQNFELNAFVFDHETAVTLREFFVADQQQCSEITLEHWQQRPLSTRIKESFARLFSPLL